MDIDPGFARALNAVLMLIILMISVGVLLSLSSRRSAYARADRFSLRVRLPYGTEETRDSVAHQTRVRGIATAMTMLVTVLILSPLLLTPLATSPTFQIVVITSVLLAVGFVSAIVQVRERLFHPAPNATRIARVRTLHAGDYLDPIRRLLPGALTIAAALAVAALLLAWRRTPPQVDSAFATTALFAGALTAFALIAAPLFERQILAQPQPASDTLELAWDDALRATALGTLRLTVALAAWMTFALAVGAMWLSSDVLFSSFAAQLPTWGMIALQFVYPSTGRRLRTELYPDWLRQRLTQGTPA